MFINECIINLQNMIEWTYVFHVLSLRLEVDVVSVTSATFITLMKITLFS